MWEQLNFWTQYQLAQLHKRCLQSGILKLTQQLKLKRLNHHLHTKIPFYRDLESRSFEQLPIMDKSSMQENFACLNSKQLTKEQALSLAQKGALHINPSLGTSGNSSLYLFSHPEIQREMISTLSNVFSAGVILPKKVALFYLGDTPYFKPITGLFKWCFINLRESLTNQLEILTTFSPDVIIAPVQTLCMLATLQLEKKLYLKTKRFVSTQEVLTIIEEKFIATTFEQNVRQLYQCAEGFIGFTCAFGTLHLNESQYYIEKEWVDDIRFIPVITALNRFLQPLVRYRMDDILSIKTTSCPCESNFVAIERIVGRCEDTLYFSCSNHHLNPIYSDYFHLAISKAVGNIQKYQLLQHSPTQLEIKLCAKNMTLATNSITQQFEKLFQQFGALCPHLMFSNLEPPPLSEVFRQTKRLIKMPTLETGKIMHLNNDAQFL